MLECGSTLNAAAVIEPHQASPALVINEFELFISKEQCEKRGLVCLWKKVLLRSRSVHLCCIYFDNAKSRRCGSMGLALKCLDTESGTRGAQHPSSSEHPWLFPHSSGGPLPLPLTILWNVKMAPAICQLG